MLLTSHLLSCSDLRQVDSEGGLLTFRAEVPACCFLSALTALRSLIGSPVCGSVTFSSSLQSHLHMTSLGSSFALLVGQ